MRLKLSLCTLKNKFSSKLTRNFKIWCKVLRTIINAEDNTFIARFRLVLLTDNYWCNPYLGLSFNLVY